MIRFSGGSAEQMCRRRREVGAWASHLSVCLRPERCTKRWANLQVCCSTVSFTTCCRRQGVIRSRHERDTTVANLERMEAGAVTVNTKTHAHSHADVPCTLRWKRIPVAHLHCRCHYNVVMNFGLFGKNVIGLDIIITLYVRFCRCAYSAR